MNKYLEFRERYPLFSYHGYHIEETSDAIMFRYDFEIAGTKQAVAHPTAPHEFPLTESK